MRTRGGARLAQPTLDQLFELMYYVSLRTEESQPITFHIVYLDPKNPDPHPPRRIVQDRWNYVRFDKPIPATIINVVKLAKASDARTSSFVIYPDGDHLSIWGLIDQGNRYYDFVNYDSETGPERPGIFQAGIVGTGHLVAYIAYEKIAELRVNVLVTKALDVLRGDQYARRWNQASVHIVTAFSRSSQSMYLIACSHRTQILILIGLSASAACCCEFKAFVMEELY